MNVQMAPTTNKATNPYRIHSSRVGLFQVITLRRESQFLPASPIPLGATRENCTGWYSYHRDKFQNGEITPFENRFQQGNVVWNLPPTATR
jgi:hypothetical protein